MIFSNGLNSNSDYKTKSHKKNNIPKTKTKVNYVFKKSCKEVTNFPNNLEIETVNNFKDFKKFYHLPFCLYKDIEFWIPPFWKEQKDFFKANNPFWTHSECRLFIAKKNNEIVGRIATIIDHKFCETIGEKIGLETKGKEK